MMMVVMVGGVAMVVIVGGVAMVNMALVMAASLVPRLQLQGGMRNTVLLQFLPNLLLNNMGIVVGYNVHCGIIAAAVHSPNMDMMDIKHAVNGRYMLFYLFNGHIGRGLDQKQIQHLL